MGHANDFIVNVERLSVNRTGGTVLKEISFTLRSGDHLAITGASGSGKTTMGMALAGKMFYKGAINVNMNKAGGETGNKVWVEQQHHFRNLSNTTDFYYQQRFNSCDAEDALTVKEVLGAGSNAARIIEMMKIEDLLDKPLIQLSNGENKKLQLAGALIAAPSMLIMDQPFVGLDRETREYLHHLLDELARQGILLILITTPDEIPACVSKVLTLENGCLKTIETRQDFVAKLARQDGKSKYASDAGKEQLSRLISSFPPPDYNHALLMKKVTVEYDGKKILDGIDWEVGAGERWLLSGPNGAGKSTLLSLVTADNPQAYANQIWLFDKKRGTGESIWDIKKRIGYLSPELHLFFDQGSTCLETVASGLFDTIGLFRQLSEQDIQWVQEWLRITGIQQLSQKRLYELSVGEQRVVLLTRALVKNPSLLILDEPCQGLDSEKQAALHELIDTVCVAGNKTLVFVTHYAEDRPACINRFLRLEKGRVVEKS
jgi:molybdate transport system ATP-binding protein